MQKIVFLLIAAMFFNLTIQAKGDKDSLQILENQIKFMDSVESALKWETSSVTIANGVAKLNLPAGFKF